jgi:hypothetical protein
MKTIIVVFFTIWCGAALLGVWTWLAFGMWYIAVIPAIMFCVGLGTAIFIIKTINTSTEIVSHPEPNINKIKEENYKKLNYINGDITKPKYYFNIIITINNTGRYINQLCNLLYKNYRGNDLKYMDVMNGLRKPPMDIWLQFNTKKEITDFTKSLDSLGADYIAENTGSGIRGQD